MKRFTAMFMPIRPLVVVLTSNCVAKRKIKSDMPVAVTGGVRLSVEGPSVSGLPRLKPDPFASWQRGSNENFNALLRQYIPKMRPLSTVTDKELRIIKNKLNNRPCKRLGFKTPNEVFMQSFNRVALCVESTGLNK
jgi:hypothetical protein